MKAFKIISVAMMALLMAAGFTACSKMENDEPQKRLAKFAFGDDSFSHSITFKYDDKGLLKNAILETVFYGESNTSTYIDSYNYVWNSQSIDVAFTSSNDGIILDQNEYTYHLSEGLIRSKNYSDDSGHSFSFRYDSSNRLIRYDNLMIAWDDDKLTSLEVDDKEYWYAKSFTYGTAPAVKGYSPLALLNVTGEALILAHPELAGLMTNKIPITEITLPNELNQQTRFEYEIDKDGYISKAIEIWTQMEDELWSTGYITVWE